MKRKLLFVVVPVLLFACVFTMASCSCSNKSDQDINSSSSSDVTSTNIDSSDDISLDEPVSSDDPVNSEIEDDIYYTITFKDYDGTVLQTSSVKEGETPTYNQATPTRDNDDNYSYAFSGWSPSISEVNADAIYTATYTSTIRQYNLTLNKNINNAGNVTGAGTYHFNDSLTITATTNPGYTFNGWYDGGTLVSNELSYTFNMPTANKSYEARWTANTNTAYKVEHYWQNIENDNYTLYETDNLTGTTNTSTNAVAKSYTGFASPTSVEQININGAGSTVVELYYTRNIYTVALNKNIDNAGNVAGAGTYKYGAEVTISATTNPGYTFMGWYDGETLVSNELSYTFNMPTANKSYEARWTANTYTVALSKNIDSAGSIDGAKTYKYGAQVTISATTNPDYTFMGWYDGETLVSNELSYTFNMPAANKSYEARWAANTTYKVEHYWQNIEDNNYTLHETDNLTGTIDTLTNAVAKTYTGFASPTSVEQINIKGDGSTVVKLYYTRNTYTVTLSKNIDNAGNVSGEGTYKYGAEVTISATTNPGYTFNGWYDEETLVYSDASKTFVMPAEDITYTAKYINYYKKVENKVYFGTYPQTQVEATNENGLSSITFDSTTWTSYKYYISSTQSDYMYYKDVDINNDGINDYRGVYFNQYRPSSIGNASSTSTTQQDDNGYSIDTIYWFSYDPIEWNILKEEENGKALILANLILDSQEYYLSSRDSQFDHNGDNGYANNYKLSEIRKFLNNNFYNTAFNELQKTLIQTTTVDNSVSSTGTSSNIYACDDTEDKMFLLSYSEAKNSNYGFTDVSARQAQGSDYAKCQGLHVNTNNNSDWWLRSPNCDFAFNAYYVSYNGLYANFGVSNTNSGVRPACWINLL